MAIATGPVSPYISPEQLDQFPLGISWNSIPAPGASDAQKYAAKTEICAIATGRCDTAAAQVLRATSNTEQLIGPDFRVTMQGNGMVRLLLSQWPILSVSAIQVAPVNAFPVNWTQVTAGNWWVERPPLMVAGTSAANDAGTGGQSVLLGPGYITWLFGRSSWVIQTTYTAGWPHCGLTTAAAAGSTTLAVDDCTGWAPAVPGGQGITGVVHDPVNLQEAVTCTAASAVSGPGTLTLAAPTMFSHDAGVLVSALPDQILWATAKFAAAVALTRGATATTIHTTSPRSQPSMSGHKKMEMEACADLKRFARVI